MTTIHCSKCFRETNHDSLFKASKTESSERVDVGSAVLDVGVGYVYSLFECRGCHNVVMRKALWSSELTPDEYDPSYISWHPPLARRQPPSWLNELSDNIQRSMFKEVYAALHNDIRSLAMMGVRALVDMFLASNAGDIGGFDSKLKRLTELGSLSARQVALLKPTIDSGSAAAHRGHIPSLESLTAALDVVEHLFQQNALGKSVDHMASETPARQGSAHKKA